MPACQVNDLVYYNGAISASYFNSEKITNQTHLVLSGGGGLAGGRFFFISTTNLAIPLSQWLVVTTNYFDSSGRFSLTQPMNKPKEFFLLKPD